MAQRPLWTCPRCGKSYVTRNMWHSCVIVPLESHESQLDVELRAWLREARTVGDQLQQGDLSGSR